MITKINKTSTTCWSVDSDYICLGSAAGALDSTFTAVSELEIYSCTGFNRIINVTSNSRFPYNN